MPDALEHPHDTALARDELAAAGGEDVAAALLSRSCSRLYLPARSGASRLEVGLIQSFDAATNTAMVRLLGAQANLIGPLPVAAGLASDLLVPGAACLVLLLDQSNAADALIAAMVRTA